jgi:hypothetical protein
MDPLPAGRVRENVILSWLCHDRIKLIIITLLLYYRKELLWQKSNADSLNVRVV